ncbi:MAG TPA: DNA polymerase III subunit gamma/tau [Thermomicrobiales bacterium]|nr:DNA polymerase III subunit gamma/tau [Thermomicrobiales bacterium]
MSASSLFPELPGAEPGESGASSSFGATQSLYRKYRPQTFAGDDLVGQDTIVRTLRNAIKLDRVAHAYLFTGPRGTGKTTTARLLAKAVNCLDPDPEARPCNACAACVAITASSTTDIIEIDAASNRGIDDIRELRERVKFAPTFLRTKFYIVDEAHQITGAAANAFLKTLEEPPPHTKFILATTDPEQLLPTIVSRCQRFDFKRFPRGTIVSHLTRVAELEGVPVGQDALAVIGEHAGGSMRDALGILDQLASYRERIEGENERLIDADDVRNLLGVARGERVIQLADALADGDAGKGLALINGAFEAGEDPRQLNRQLVNLLRAVMFRVASGAPSGDPDIDQLAPRFTLAAIARHSSRFSEIDYRIRHASLPQLPLEIAFVQATLDAERTQNPPTSGAARVTQEAAAPLVHTESNRVQRSRELVENISEPKKQAASLAPVVRDVWEQPVAAPSVPDLSEPGSNSRSPAPSVPSTPLSGEITVDLLHDLWPKIRLDVKARDRRIEALLSSCDPASVSGSSIVLITNYKFHLEKMNEDAARDLVEGVIGRLVNRTVSVRTEMRGSAGSPASNGAAAREPMKAVESVPASATPASAAPDPEPTAEDRTVLEAAKNIFDAEEISPRP